MRIRNFQAKSVSEALGMVKKELGPDAVILKTTPMDSKGSRIGGKMFQVTACIDDGSLHAKRGSEHHTERAGGVSSSDIDGIKDVLRILQRDVRYLTMLSMPSGSDAGLDDKLASCFHDLTGSGIDPAEVGRILREVQESGVDVADDDIVRNAIVENMLSNLAEPFEIKQYARGPNSVAFVGPPGAGKSSMAAKLAAHFVVEKKTAVKLVSLDDFRPTAGDELKRFADALDVPFAAADYDPIGETKSSVVLIDTAGVPVGADSERDELRSKLDKSGVSEVHLVLPAYCSASDMIDWYDFFRPIGLTAVSFAFLDQTANIGAVVNLSLVRNAKFSYFSFGRTSSKNLESADPAKLVRRMLAV
jgi:flagellar biosynthesis protein FlhF